MKILLIEDEIGPAQALETMITKNFKVDEIRTVRQLRQCKSEIESFNPDIIFLDVHLPDGSGMEIFDIPAVEKIPVVFSTAYDEYALQAFKYHALDYLLKPIVEEELLGVLNRFNSQYEKLNIAGRDFYNEVQSQTGTIFSPKKITLPSNFGFIMVEIESIIRCEADGNYVRFYLSKGKSPILVSKKLNYYEDLLKERSFSRIHRSHMVNLDHVLEFSRKDGGFVVMSDDSQIPISRSAKNNFLKQFQLE